MSCLVLLVCLVAVFGDQRITTSDGTTFDFIGQSGQIKLTPSGSSDWIKVKWDKINELDSNGNVVASVNNFASQEFVWSTPTVATLADNTTASMVTLIADLKNGASFNVTCWVFNRTVTVVTNTDEVTTVPGNSLKFSVHVANWPWTSSGTNLTFGAQLLGQGGNQSSSSSNTNSSQTVHFGVGWLESIYTALYDGAVGPVGVATSQSGNSVYVDWNFSFFKHTLDYDPVLSASGDQKVVTSDGTTFDFVGLSGQIKLTPAGSKNWIKVNWEKINEISADNSVVATVNNFASQQFVWTDPAAYVFPDNSTASMVTLEAQLDNGASFNVSCWVFNESVAITVDNETVWVPQSSLKFSVHIVNWPWKSTGNRLVFGAQLLRQGGKSSASSSNDSSSHTVEFGVGSLKSVTSALYDNVNGSVAVTSSESGGSVYVDWTFNHFDHTLDYDPILWGSSASRVMAPLMTIFGAIFLALFNWLN